MCTNTFLGIISAQKRVSVVVRVYPNPGTVVEWGTKVCLGKATGRGENVSLGTALAGGCTSRTTMDPSARVKKCTADPVAAAEGVVHAGASTALQMHTLLSP